MVEDLSSCYKDTYALKIPKMNSLILKMITLVIATICGLYICSMCLKQISNQTKPNIEVIERLSNSYDTVNSESPYLHYPHPETFNRSECAGNPVRFFVIISMQRSGSGWFETLLNSHTNVSSNGEIFSVNSRRSNISSIIRTLDRVYNLDWFNSASKNECSAAIGFKWMLNQGLMDYPSEIGEYFSRRRVSAIFLFRRNQLRRLISVLSNSYDSHAKQLNGTHKAHVHSLEEAETLSKYKPFINSTSLLSALKDSEFTMAQALAYFNRTRHITLYYEDLIKNSTKLVDVQNFLRIPLMKLKSRHVKIHKGPLRDHIKNWEDVNKTLNGTVYEKFLHLDY
ncbi:unnamed protein product [Amaranthus hypochondriacus]